MVCKCLELSDNIAKIRDLYMKSSDVYRLHFVKLPGLKNTYHLA